MTSPAIRWRAIAAQFAAQIAAQVAVFLALAAGAPAATITWDADGTTGGVSDGAGVWLGANQWWDGASNVSWTSGDDAVFGVGGTGGAVTLSAPTTAGSLTFNPFSGTYTLGTAGQALTLGSGGLTMNAGAGAVTLVSPVTLGAAQIWTNDSASLFTTSAATTNAGHLLTVTGSGNASLAAVSGAGGLAKSGSGTLSFGNVQNSYTGGTVVDGGTLTLGNGAENGNIRGSLTINQGATVNASAQAWSLGYGGTRSGATFSGTSVTSIAINGGLLNFTNPNSGAGLATNEIVLTGGTIGGASFGWINSNTLTPTVQTLASSARSTLSGGISLRLSSSGTLTFDVASGSTPDGIDLLVSGPISNSTVAGTDNGGVLAKTGAGTLVLSGSNTFDGGIFLSSGKLDLNSNTALGTGTLRIAGGMIGNSSGVAITNTANNAQAWNGDFGFNGPSSLNLGTGAVTLGANRAVTISTGTLTVGGGISGVGFGLTKSGSGTLTLTGANTFTGATSISAGTLQVGNGGTTGTLGSGAVTNDGTLAFNRSNSIAVANAISGTGSVVQQGGGTLTLTAINSFTGGTAVEAGTLSLGNGAADGVIRGSLAIAPGARVIASANGWSLGYGGTRLGATYPGNSVTAITIDGGTLEFTNANSGAGLAASEITLAGGTIAGASFGWINTNTLTPTLRTLASATRSTLEGGISLRLSTAGALTFDVASGSTADGIDLLVSGPISQPAAGDNIGGSIAKTGVGRLVLSGSNTFTGGLTLSAGQLDLNHASALGAGTFTIAGGTIGNSSGSPITLSTNNAQAWNSDVTFVGPSSLNLGTGAVTLGASRTVTVSGDTLTVGGGISGSGFGLTKSGSGLLVLSGSNTFTGGLTVSAGTLQLAGSGVLGAGGSYAGAIAIAAGASFATDSAANQTLSGTISGSGGLTKSGAGTLALGNVQNTYTGGTVVEAGTLSLGNGAANGVIRGSLAIAPGARVIASATGWSLGYGGTRVGATYPGNSVTAITIDGGTLEFTNPASGAGLAASEITLTGGTIAGASFGWINSNTLTPTLRTLASATRSTLQGGISLRLSTAGTLTFDVASGSTADGIDLFVSGPIATAGLPLSGDNNGGNLTKTGPGTLALAAANTFTGSTSITGGRLQVDPTGSFTATSGITLAGGELRYNSATALARPLALTAGTISGTGTIATPVTVATGGVLSPGNSPGTQAYTQGLTWNGGGSYLWEVNALSGTAGTNWDLLNVSGGTFDLSGLSAGSRFILDLTTLTAADLPGPLAVPFDGGAYAFPIASYATLSSPLGTSALTDLTSLFDLRLDNWAAPKPGLGDISVRINAAADGIELVVVPEPSAAAGGLVAVGLAAWRLRRRGPRKSS